MVNGELNFTPGKKAAVEVCGHHGRVAGGGLMETGNLHFLKFT